MIKRNATIEVEDITLVGQILLPDGDGPYPIVCVCHGIPTGKAPDKDDQGYPALAERLCREGMAAFVFNFRGTGISGGNIDLPGWARDLTSVLDYIRALPEIDPSRIGLLGFSGGAATAVCVASGDHRVFCVAACACPAEFSGLLDEGDAQSYVDHFRGIGLIRDKDFPRSNDEWFDHFRNVSPVLCIGRIAPRPLLIIHGNHDEVVDISHAHRLYEKACEPKELVVLEKGGHTLRLDERAVRTFIDWFQSQLHI